MKKKLLITTDWFYPGYKAGGIIRACYNMATLLKDEYSVFILTSDRDCGDHKGYHGITKDQWIDFGKGIQVYYTSPGKLGVLNILKQVRFIKPDFIYLTSMYSVLFTIFPLLMKRVGIIKSSVILTPSGMLHPNALKSKAVKKKYFLAVLNLLRIQHIITFHATDSQEKNDVAKVFGETASVCLLHCVPSTPEANISSLVKQPGMVKLAFVGRIHPHKNLHFLMECLAQVTANIELTIIGPVEDEKYYEQCKKLGSLLPVNIQVSFTGEVAYENVKQYLDKNHFLVLPTLSENFGYAIVEAFGTGKPVITSDQTPWRNLEQLQIGWDLPVNNHGEFIRCINRAAHMEQDEYQQWSEAAWHFAGHLMQKTAAENSYVQMFDNQSKYPKVGGLVVNT